MPSSYSPNVDDTLDALLDHQHLSKGEHRKTGLLAGAGLGSYIYMLANLKAHLCADTSSVFQRCVTEMCQTMTPDDPRLAYPVGLFACCATIMCFGQAPAIQAQTQERDRQILKQLNALNT